MTNTYVDIIVDIVSEKLDRSFQYLVPEHLEGKLQPGRFRLETEAGRSKGM